MFLNLKEENIGNQQTRYRCFIFRIVRVSLDEMIVYIIIAAAVLLYWILSRRSRGLTLPGPRGLPLLGNSLELTPETFHHTLKNWAKKYGPIFKCNAMGIDMVVLSKPDLIREAYGSETFGKIFADRPASFVGKYIFKNYKGIVIGRNNDTTFKLRKLFHTALHIYGDGIEAFENNFHSEVKKLIEIIAALEGQDFDPRPIFERSLGNLMTILLCGEPMSKQDEQLVWCYVNALNKCFTPTYEFFMYNFPFLRFTPGYFGDIYRNVMSGGEEIKKRYVTPFKDTYVSGTERGVVDAILKLQTQLEYESKSSWLDDEQVAALAQTVIGGGLLTSTNTLLGIFLLLPRYPDCLAKIYEEVMSVVGDDRLPVLSDKQNMPYTESAIMECQRMSNLVPIPMPHNCSEDTMFEGYEIKKDTRILANLWTINQDPEVWEEPEKFCPERFLDSDGNLLPPEHPTRKAFLLFGVGRRNCVGEVLARSRLFLYVSILVQQFRFLPPESEPLGSADPSTFGMAIVLMPGAYKIRAVARKR